jgi:hypothetical protein
MNSSVTRSFRERLARLPPTVQARARKQYVLWLRDHWHPSLHFKKVGEWWSVRVDDQHRALGLERAGRIHWFFIGRHDEYEERI